jgi:DNA repair exonuclease SbcCD nuclease subunit
MAKIAMITDTHWGVRNDSPIFLDYFKKCVDEFFLPTIKEKGVGAIVHLGDLVDRRKYVNINTAHRLHEDFLKPINELKIPILMIAGNHDEYYKDTHKINSLDVLLAGRYENIHHMSTPQTIALWGTYILMLPWITKDNEAETMEALKNTNASIVMGHLELEGFEFYKGQVSDHGTADKRVFDKFHSVYSGHYHHRSSIDNITYLGAFTEHIWSDYNDPRGFTILDTETLETTFYRNPYSMFHMVGYDDVKHPDIIEKIQATDYSKYKDTYVKIVCVNKTNPFAFDMLLDKLYKESPADISIVEDVNLFTDTAADDVIDQAQDTVTILDNYITGLTLPVDNDKMKTYMRDVYLEAVTLENVE